MCAQEAFSTKRRKKIGSSVAQRTTFLSRRKESHGEDTNNQAAVPRPGPPRVTFRRVVAPLRGPGQSPVLPFACCAGALLSAAPLLLPPPPPRPPAGAELLKGART